MKSKLVILLVLGVLLAIPSPAQTASKKMTDVAGFKEKLAKGSMDAQTLECDFVQKKHLEVLTKPVLSKGHFCYKRENLIRWEYLTPYQYLVIINNDKILVKDNSKTNTIDTKSNKMYTELTSMMASCMKGNLKDIEKSYTVQYLENEQSFITLLTPISKEAQKYLKNIEMHFDRKDMMVSHLIMYEASNDFTEYDFTNRKLNQPIANDKFSIH